MRKTPEEIKKGLECCAGMRDHSYCLQCPYADEDCDEMSRDALALIEQLKEREWELFSLLSSAFYGKQCYFKQDDGTVYSRATCEYLSFDQAVDEFAKALTYAGEAQSGTDMNVPRWISVEERLPEKHGQMCVGLYNQHGAAPRTMLFPYIFTWHAYGDNGYVNGPHFSDEGLDGLKVWYWMPLPELPKEGSHGRD